MSIRSLLLKLGLLDIARQAFGILKGVAVRFDKDVIHIRKGKREIRISRAHDFYTAELVRMFDYHFGAVVPQEAGGQQVVDYSAPRVHRLKQSGVELEFPSVAEGEESIEGYLKALALKPGDVVFDLGAYAGGTSYFLAKAVGPEGLVLALEPDQTTFRCLEANMKRHALGNVKCLASGVWTEKTTLKFQAEGTMGSSAAGLVGRETHVVEVPVMTLTDLATLANGRPVAGIKMDIEGAELPILRSASAAAFFAKQKPNIVVEPHIVDGRFDTDEVCQILRSFGYELEMLPQGMGQAWPLIAGKARR